VVFYTLRKTNWYSYKNDHMDMSEVTTSLISRIILFIISTLVVVIVQRVLSNEPILPGGGGQNARDARVDAMVTMPDQSRRLSDVGGHTTVKEELINSVTIPMRNPDVFYRSGLRSVKPPSGILLHGPPGTGKTMLARAVAAESGVPMITLHSAALESKWWGDSPKLLQAVFTQARKRYAPCIIFMDEIDGLGRARSESDQSCVYSFKCEMLRNMDSIQDEPVVVIACTNCPQSLDPALSRRFQRKVEVPRPTRDERASILTILMNQEHGDSVTASGVADRTERFTGADLSSLYEAACSCRLVRVGKRIERALNDVDLVRILGPLTMEDVCVGSRRISRPLQEHDDEDIPRVHDTSNKYVASKPTITPDVHEVGHQRVAREQDA
jgi:SpoVK/Ycf46/Vps4 family AAA+-type ATPase